MFQKSFVSVFFSSERIQIVQLDSKKKSLKKRTFLKLPSGIITNYAVKDKKALAELLRGVWRSAGIGERSVGIVVPEFSTFTKNMVLPKIDMGELDEAVRWQIQDYLPSGSQDMVLDWKIVASDDENYQVLVVAIPREVLAGFVDSVGLANLYPLAVETPSLSLVRIAPGARGRLILYGSSGEVTLVVAHGDKILGSSVVNTSDGTDIAQTAMQIVKHYKTVEVEKILIGGLGFSQEHLASLQKKLGKEVSWIKANISGVTPEEFQEYLIPISAQLKDPAEPRDETTINLLPPDWVKVYQDKKTKSELISLTLVASAITLGCLWAASGTLFVMNQKLSSLASNETGGENLIDKNVQEVVGQIKSINEIITKVDKILSARVSPNHVIDTINSLKPSGVTISDYNLELDAGKISLKGKAASRQDLINFRKALEDHADFSRVSIPVSSLEAETDLEFSLNLVYGQAATKAPTQKLKLN